MDFCLKWRHHITNIEVLAVPKSPTQLYFLLQQRRLRWLGHIHRMAGGRIPKDLLYGQLAARSRSQRHFEKTRRLTFASRLSARLIWSTRAWYGLRKLGGTGQRAAPLEAWAQQRACQSRGQGPCTRSSARSSLEELLKRNAVITNIVGGLHSAAPPTSAAAVEKIVLPHPWSILSEEWQHIYVYVYVCVCQCVSIYIYIYIYIYTHTHRKQDC